MRFNLKNKDIKKEKNKDQVQDENIEIINDEVVVLSNQLDELQSQNKDYLDKMLRLKAEFENYKKRMIKEQNMAVKYASENVIHSLLPIVDNLDRALLAISDELDPTKIIEGVRLTHQDIKKLLDDHLVEEINPVGELFNPEEHEALLSVKSDIHEDEEIVEVLQKGYKLNGKVVRAAKVSICKKD